MPTTTRPFGPRLTDDGKVATATTGSTRTLAKLDPEKFAAARSCWSPTKNRATVFELDLDPYERSFRHVSTHLLMQS